METIMNLFGDEFLSKAFALSLITGSLVYLRKWPNYIWERVRRLIVFTVRVEQTDALYEYIERWIRNNYFEKYRNVIANIGETGEENEAPNEVNRDTSERTEDKDEVKYKHNQDVLFVRRNGLTIKINKGRDRLDHAQSFSSLFFNSYEISTLFFKKKVMELLDEIVEYNQQFKKKNNELTIYSFDGYGHWTNMRNIAPKSVENIILPFKTKLKILNDFSTFETSHDWYTDRSISYKRGYLFYGPPGNGKTSMALALAGKYRRDIYSLSLSDVESDKSLKQGFANINKNAIVLMEDIDSVFTGRKSDSKISFSALLNCLDGIFFREGIVTILTTNHIEKLDEALIREGRVDCRVEFTNPNEDCVKEYVELFYDCSLNGEVYNMTHSMSKIQNYCLRNSLEKIKKVIFKNQPSSKTISEETIEFRTAKQ